MRMGLTRGEYLGLLLGLVTLVVTTIFGLLATPTKVPLSNIIAAETVGLVFVICIISYSIRNKLSDSRVINPDRLSSVVQKEFPDRQKSPSREMSQVVSELAKSGHKKLGDVRRVIKTSREDFLRYEQRHPPDDQRGTKYDNAGVVRILFELYDREVKKTRGSS
jgi:hypothetical protein